MPTTRSHLKIHYLGYRILFVSSTVFHSLNSELLCNSVEAAAGLGLSDILVPYTVYMTPVSILGSFHSCSRLFRDDLQRREREFHQPTNRYLLQATPHPEETV